MKGLGERAISGRLYKYCFSFLETDAWLAGLLTTGELFLWNKDQDCLKTIQATGEPKEMIKAAVGESGFNWFNLINRKEG